MKTGEFKKSVCVIAISAMTLVNSPMATAASQQEDNSSQTESVGFGVGAVIGAILGGPAGAFITGVAGGFIGKSIDAEQDMEALELTLQEQQMKHQQQVAKFQQKLKQSEIQYQSELLALEQNYQDLSQVQAENLLMSLQFSTGSSKIAPHYQEQIQALVKLLAKSPKMKIDLSGYTDLQGDEEKNQHLSLARVNSVKNALINQGIEAGRIQTFAYGEQFPVVANAQKEVSFYDRRVVVKLHQDTNQVANNH